MDDFAAGRCLVEFSFLVGSVVATVAEIKVDWVVRWGQEGRLGLRLGGFVE